MGEDRIASDGIEKQIPAKRVVHRNAAFMAQPNMARSKMLGEAPIQKAATSIWVFDLRSWHRP
jgi:hypothetical protein